MPAEEVAGAAKRVYDAAHLLAARDRAGSDEGAANWAAVSSLVETYKLYAVDPQRYLANTLTRLVNGWPQSRIDELMPWASATGHAA